MTNKITKVIFTSYPQKSPFTFDGDGASNEESMNSIKLKAIELAQGNVDKAKEIEAYLNNEDSNDVKVEVETVTDSKGNTGNRNTGNRNTGYHNTGDWNTGNWNTGDWNTGDWNTGSWNTGFFNTETPELINVFDKPTLPSVWDDADKPGCLYFDLTEWIDESEMSDVEKQENPSFSCTGGYLKKYDYKEAFTKSVAEASKEDRDLIRKLPNFNNEKFLEISGVDLSQLD